MIFTRIVIFGVVLVLAAVGPWFIFLPLLVLYVFLYIGTEVLIIAMLVDSYFLYNTGTWPWYTIATTILLIFAHWLRPHISLYNNK